MYCTVIAEALVPGESGEPQGTWEDDILEVDACMYYDSMFYSGHRMRPRQYCFGKVNGVVWLWYQQMQCSEEISRE